MKRKCVLTQCQWLFDLALCIHWQPDTLDDAVHLRQRTAQIIESLYDEQLNDKEIASIRYALAALLDELIAHSSWREKDKWLARPLQVILFDDYLAGEKYFEKLAALQKESATPSTVLHVYHTCLQLGFQGKYRLRNPDCLTPLKQRLLQRLLDESEPIDTEALPDRETTTDKGWQRYMANKRILYGFAAGLSVLIYLTYQIISWQLHQRIALS